MNIILSQKDADFILKFIRADLEKVSEGGKRVEKSGISLLEKCSADQNSEIASEIKSITQSVLAYSKEQLIEVKTALNRCIELLTVGSEDAE